MSMKTGLCPRAKSTSSFKTIQIKWLFLDQKNPIYSFTSKSIYEIQLEF